MHAPLFQARTPASTRERIPDEAWWVWTPLVKKQIAEATKARRSIVKQKLGTARTFDAFDDLNYEISRNFGSVVDPDTGQAYEAAYL